MSIGASVLLIIIVGAVAWVVFFSDSEPDDDFTLELLAADPVRYDRTVLPRLDCPNGRGASPLLDVEHELGVTSVGAGYASGQVAAFTMSVTADQTTDPLELSLTPGAALSQGLDCVFVDPTDRSAVERNGGTNARATWNEGADGGIVSISGLEAGETAIVEIWGVVNADPEEARLPILLSATGADEGVLANVTVLNFSSALQGTGDVPEMELSIDGPTKPLAAGNRVKHKVTLANSSLSAPASFAVLTGSVDNGGIVDSVELVDTEGTKTKCDDDGATYSCNLGFVDAEETIVFEVVLGADQAALTNDGPRRAASDCSTPLPHICHEVEFTQTGSFSPARASDEKSVTITTQQVFLASVEHDPPTAYVGGSIDLTLTLAVSDGRSRAEDPEIRLEACNNGAVRYVNGDDGDFILTPDERWEYACRADDLEGPLTIATVSASDGAKQINETFTVTLDVINPHMSTETIPVVTGSAWDLINDGDQAIENIQLNSDTEGCDVNIDAGDELSRGVLEVNEVWNLRCDVENANLIVFGFDPLGESLSSIE
jgi:hypothetical protein